MQEGWIHLQSMFLILCNNFILDSTPKSWYINEVIYFWYDHSNSVEDNLEDIGKMKEDYWKYNIDVIFINIIFSLKKN